MDVFWAISIGVISAVISAALLFIARTLIVGHLLPWHHDRVYRGIKVDGHWYASSFDMAQDFTIDLKQRAGTITGDAQFSKRPDSDGSGFEEVRSFDVEGRIQDRYLTFTLSHKNRQRIGVVAFLLEPICDGRELAGMMTFVSMRNNAIDSNYIHLSRDPKIVSDERRRIEEALAEEAKQGNLPLRRKGVRKLKKTPDSKQDENPGEKIEIT